MSEAERPDPDKLLARMKREETAATRGKLKIFFGMSPGVGKTYAMLQAARQKQAEGCEVVVGIVETHGRKETEALVEGMPIMPRTQVEYRGTTLTEMDLDAILTWHPGLAVVDELAHTNAPGSRHPKRYQDVIELLDAGISVYTTLNVQHVASRSDTVRQISGITVSETVPDSVLDLADEIVLVDLTPEQLRQRLAEGKVYLGERAEWAAKNFFRESNLTALREMALRLVAEHVDRDLRDIMSEEKIVGPMEKQRSFACRRQCQSIFRATYSLHPPAGCLDGSVVDCRQHRTAAGAVGERTVTSYSLSRARAPARRGSDFHARHRYRRSVAPYRPSTQRHADCNWQTARFAMDKLFETRPAALAHAQQRQHRHPHDPGGRIGPAVAGRNDRGTFGPRTVARLWRRTCHRRGRNRLLVVHLRLHRLLGRFAFLSARGRSRCHTITPVANAFSRRP